MGFFGIFTNLCLVLLSLFAGSLVPKLLFNFKNEKRLERSPENGRTMYELADGVTALVQFRVLYSDKTRSFNQWQRVLCPNSVPCFVL